MVTKRENATKTVAATASKAEVAASGAIIEPEIVERIDTTHPAVDDEPRKGVPEASNQIDFNDPTLSPEEAVLRHLGA